MKKVTRIRETAKKTSNVPVIIEWKNARMIRSHSINAAVAEILNLSEALDLVKINIVGNPSTGKSTLAETLGHLIHKKARIPFNVRSFGREELGNFAETVKSLAPTNHVLLFDDVTHLKANMTGKQLLNVEKELTEIRHLEGGKDVKIILIMNSHYTRGVSKYMRQSDFYLYTSVGASDASNLLEVTGGNYSRIVKLFQKLTFQASTQKSFSFQLGRKRGNVFTYKWRQPFAPILWYNNDTARIVVFPSREWIDPVCSVCSNASSAVADTADTIEKMNDMATLQFGERVIRQALRIILFNHGVMTYRKSVKQCMIFIERFMEKNEINFETLMKFYNLEDKRTRDISYIFADGDKSGNSH